MNVPSILGRHRGLRHGRGEVPRGGCPAAVVAATNGSVRRRGQGHPPRQRKNKDITKCPARCEARAFSLSHEPGARVSAEKASKDKTHDAHPPFTFIRWRCKQPTISKQIPAAFLFPVQNGTARQVHGLTEREMGRAAEARTEARTPRRQARAQTAGRRTDSTEAESHTLA